jgi:hypothetical protein
MMLLANPDSHFSPQKPINIMGHFLYKASSREKSQVSPLAKDEAVPPFPKGGRRIWCNMQTFQQFKNTSQTCSDAGDCSHRFILLPVTRHSSLITLITSPDHVWIAETLTTTHVSLFHNIFSSQNCDYLITYLITIYYYVDYLSRRSKILKTENWKLKTEIL